jgi:hypothetical protein
MKQDEEIAKLRKVAPGAELWEEAGGPLVYLPNLRIKHNGDQVIANALLSPRAHSSYTTRLFFDRQFPDKGQNWTVHNLMGRTWHAMSFNNVPETLPWIEILANHLVPLR